MSNIHTTRTTTSTAAVGRPHRMLPGVDPFDLVDPVRFARRGHPYAVWTEWFEVSGPVERLSSAVNEGLKRLPIRCRWHTSAR